MRDTFNELKKKILGKFGAHEGLYHLGSNSSADWFLALTGFVLCATVIVLFSVYRFKGVPDDTVQNLVTTTASSTPSELSRDLIDRVTSYYEGRRVELSKLLKTPVSLTDPSR